MDMDSPERRVGHYYDTHRILVVGDGDFSFSLSLAEGFGGATSMVCTSLDDRDKLKKKYRNAMSNIKKLLALGCTVRHKVDATKMRLHPDLRMRKFDRIIFNFPHAGFHGKEDDEKLIRKHRKLVGSFFSNAISLLCPYGEVHVSHKISEPFNQWNLEDLAAKSGFLLADCAKFEKSDYPGYNHKRGSGVRSDEPFPLGECRTFKFQKRSFLKVRAPTSARRPESGIVHGVYLSELLQTRYESPIPDSLCHKFCQTNYEYPRSIIDRSSYSAVCSPRLLGSESINRHPLIPGSYLAVGSPRLLGSESINRHPLIPGPYLAVGSQRLSVSESMNCHQLIPSSYLHVRSLRLPESGSTNHHELIPSSYPSVGFFTHPESESIRHRQLIGDHGQELADRFGDMYNGCGEQSEWFREAFHHDYSYCSGCLSAKSPKSLYEAERDLQLQHRYQELCGRDSRSAELQRTLRNGSMTCPVGGFRF